MLKGKNVLLCVTGSIAAYKIAELASRLVKLHCNVDVIMTKNCVSCKRTEEASRAGTCTDDAECYEFYQSYNI